MRSVPRDRVVRRVLVTWMAAFAGTGCGGETPLATVTGRIEASPVEMASAVVWRDTTLIAASSIASDGGFVVAVPPAIGLELVFVTAAGTPAPVLVPIDVCSADTTLALGPLVPLDERGPCPDVGAECALAETVVTRCLDDMMTRCQATTMELRDCHMTLDAMCQPMRLTFERCIDETMGPCADEHLAWTTCEEMFACTEIEERIERECLNGCVDEMALRDAVCAVPPICSSELVFVPAEGFTSSGCGPEVPQE